MKLKRIVKNGLFAVVVGLSFWGAAPAQAHQTVIQGAGFDGRPYTLSRSLCAYPGQALRLGGMVLDPAGRPLVPPAEWVYWRVVQPNGNSIDWSPAYGPGRGPFRRDPYLERAIQLAMPARGGFRLRLEAQARQAQYTSIQIVDPRAGGARSCRWGPRDMYLDRGFEFEMDGDASLLEQ